jgi:hypothetical protein
MRISICYGYCTHITRALECLPAILPRHDLEQDIWLGQPQPSQSSGKALSKNGCIQIQRTYEGYLSSYRNEEQLNLPT